MPTSESLTRIVAETVAPKTGGCMTSERRFVVDSMLGKLAKWLRTLGFDTRYEHLSSIDQVDEFARCGYRILTRNHRWVKHYAIIWVAGNHPGEQLRDMVRALAITPKEVHLLCRCLRCNFSLQKTSRPQVEGRVPDYVFENCTDFYQCPQCRRFYWAGSHPSRMSQWLQANLGWSLTSEHQGELS